MNMASVPVVPLEPGLGGELTAVRAPRTGKMEVGILDLIEWAFQREKVGLDFDEIERETGARPGFGVEYLMILQAQLGCRVDGGGSSPRHPDADIVAAALACLPEEYGGRRMAIEIAELARVGGRPDWRLDGLASCEPIAWRGTKHGQFAVTEACTDLGFRWPVGQLTERLKGQWCRVTYSNLAGEAASRMRRYTAWWGALLELRQNLQVCSSLTSFTVSNAMPERAPWKKC